MENSLSSNPLAVVTGASSGIGFELAKVFAKNGYDLFVTAEDGGIVEAADIFKKFGVNVDFLRTDLSTLEGMENLWTEIQRLDRPVDTIALNAGFGVGGEFVQTDLHKELALVQLNISSLVYMSKKILPEMLAAGSGKILFTSSIAATMPGPYYAVYAASKAFVQSFAEALREEVKDRGVAVTALQPGATDTNFFARADMLDTAANASKKDDPATVAQEAFTALMDGRDHVVTGSMKNVVQTKIANFVTGPQGAKMQGKQTKPGSGQK